MARASRITRIAPATQITRITHVTRMHNRNVTYYRCMLFQEQLYVSGHHAYTTSPAVSRDVPGPLLHYSYGRYESNIPIKGIT